MPINIAASKTNFIKKDETAGKIYFAVGGTSQSIILLFDSPNAPGAAVTVAFTAIIKGMGRREYQILSATNPVATYSLGYDAAGAFILPVPLPLQVEEVVATLTGFNNAVDILNVDFVAERSLMAPTGRWANNASGPGK